MADFHASKKKEISGVTQQVVEEKTPQGKAYHTVLYVPRTGDISRIHAVIVSEFLDHSGNETGVRLSIYPRVSPSESTLELIKDIKSKYFLSESTQEEGVSHSLGRAIEGFAHPNCSRVLTIYADGIARSNDSTFPADAFKNSLSILQDKTLLSSVPAVRRNIVNAVRAVFEGHELDSAQAEKYLAEEQLGPKASARLKLLEKVEQQPSRPMLTEPVMSEQPAAARLLASRSGARSLARKT